MNAIRTRSGGSAGLRSASEVGLSTTTSSSASTGMPFLVGRFAPFDEWAEVAEERAGRFLEKIAPGAFSSTIARDRSRIKVLYDHGQDALLGRRPIASLVDLGEDSAGAWYRAELFDTIGARELLPLLAAGQLGSSFRFRTVRERIDQYPKRSAFNPSGLPEKTVLEVQLIEVGPTPFGVYAGATAGAIAGPPRSTAPRATKPVMSREEFLRVLATPMSRRRFKSKEEFLAYLAKN